MDGSVDEKGCLHSCDGSAELEDLMGKSGWKHCPGCKIPTEKIEGCNHMRVCVQRPCLKYDRNGMLINYT